MGGGHTKRLFHPALVLCWSQMGFSTELQGQASHEALLRLQETEIQLLEVVKRCVVQRVKCDRDYASAISAMLVTAHKFDNAEFETPTFQVRSSNGVRRQIVLIRSLNEFRVTGSWPG